MRHFKFICNLMIVLFILSALQFTACNNKGKDSKENDSTLVEVKKPFAVADYYFAIEKDRKFSPYNKAIYQRGDEVFLVLQEVGPFAVGSDSLNHAELNIKVSNAIGQIIYAKDSLFRESGHGKFENNMLKSPFGSYVSGLSNQPGKYTLCVTIYDLVSRDSIPVCDDFFLE